EKSLLSDRLDAEKKIKVDQLEKIKVLSGVEEKLKAELALSAKRDAEREATTAKLSASIKELENKLGVQAAELESRDKSIEAYKGDIDKIEARIKDLTVNKENLLRDNEKDLLDRKNLENALAGIREEKKALDGRVDALQNELAKAKGTAALQGRSLEEVKEKLVLAEGTIIKQA
ncbi:MAG: hypothetical protein HQL30_11205, partial [Candidatus Omnitrophica bacterium]|nr:hypothetical protein [Candidatus Omnitrophota bacterium]